MGKRLKRPWKNYNQMTWKEKMSLMEKEQQQEDKRQTIDPWGRCRSPHNTNSYLFNDMASSSFAKNDDVLETNTMLNVDIDDLLARIGEPLSEAPSASPEPAHTLPDVAGLPTTPQQSPPISIPDRRPQANGDAAHAMSLSVQCLGHSPSYSSTDVPHSADGVVSALLQPSPACPDFFDPLSGPQTSSVTPKGSLRTSSTRELTSALSSPLNFVSSKGPGQIVSPPVRNTKNTDCPKQLKSQASIGSCANSTASSIFEQGFLPYSHDCQPEEEPDAELVDLEDKVRMLQERIVQQRAQMASLLEELKRREMHALQHGHHVKISAIIPSVDMHALQGGQHHVEVGANMPPVENHALQHDGHLKDSADMPSLEMPVLERDQHYLEVGAHMPPVETHVLKSDQHDSEIGADVTSLATHILERSQHHAEGYNACVQSNHADDRGARGFMAHEYRDGDAHDFMAHEYKGMEDDADYVVDDEYDGAPQAKCPRLAGHDEQ